jgi:hypothetical protein
MDEMQEIELSLYSDNGSYYYNGYCIDWLYNWIIA